MNDFDRWPSDEEVEAANKDFYEEICGDELPEPQAEKTDDPTLTTFMHESRRRVFNPKFDYSEEAVNGVAIAKHLIKSPFLKFSDIATDLNLTKGRVSKARQWLVNNGFVTLEAVQLNRRGKPGEYLALTKEACGLLKGNPPAGRGSFEHKCFCNAVKEYHEEKGFGTRLEARVEGMEGASDLLAWKKGEGMFGIEITLSFSNLVHNIQDGLKSTVKYIIVVCRNKEDTEKARKIAVTHIPSLNRLQFKPIYDFSLSPKK